MPAWSALGVSSGKGLFVGLAEDLSPDPSATARSSPLSTIEPFMHGRQDEMENYDVSGLRR